ncbi:MAG: hypothetical protein P8Z76_10245, partial [Alphaproteobacteria bacterium]
RSRKSKLDGNESRRDQHLNRLYQQYRSVADMGAADGDVRLPPESGHHEHALHLATARAPQSENLVATCEHISTPARLTVSPVAPAPLVRL